jgi:hypothetical protein
MKKRTGDLGLPTANPIRSPAVTNAVLIPEFKGVLALRPHLCSSESGSSLGQKRASSLSGYSVESPTSLLRKVSDHVGKLIRATTP